ncbi:MAG: N-acetyltransferase [Chloroflexi bacterium]|nr:N-acetyltransferase [Chloroflexota bacterium]
MPRIQKAKIADVPQLHKLINEFADRGQMLPRSLSEIYENLRDYFVIRVGGEAVACVALHVLWSDAAETKSLAVAEEVQGKGMGSALVRACLEEAEGLGVSTVLALTYQPTFFEKFGFQRVDVMQLPRKLWRECYDCPKFPNCDEVALTYVFDATAS